MTDPQIVWASVVNDCLLALGVEEKPLAGGIGIRDLRGSDGYTLLESWMVRER